MATRETSYLKLPYNESTDAGFRDLYNEALTKVDEIFPNAESIKFSPAPIHTLDDSFFVPNSNFQLRDGMNKYFRKGNLIFFEAGVESKKEIKVPSNGNITNIPLGTISQAFPRVRGYFVTAITGVAAHYKFNGSVGAVVSVTSLGGKTHGNTLPKGTYFGFSGRFMTTS